MSDLDKKYTIRLDLINNIQNEKMRFSLSDNETSDFYIKITKSTGKVDLTDKIVKLYVVKRLTLRIAGSFSYFYFACSRGIWAFNTLYIFKRISQQGEKELKNIFSITSKFR